MWTRPSTPSSSSTKASVVREAHDLALHTRADRVLLGHADPGILAQLLVAERHPLALRIEVEDDDVDLVADLEHLARVRDATPRHVRDVQQAIDAAEVGERTVVGDVLDHAAKDVARHEPRDRDLLLFCASCVENGLARYDHVGATAVDLDHADLDLLALHCLEVPHRTQIHLRTRQECAHADVDRKAALDAIGNDASDRLLVVEGLLDTAPDLHLLGLVARDDDVAVAVLTADEQNLYLVTGLDVDLAHRVLELVERDEPFGLVADVDDDLGLADLDNPAVDDIAFGQVLQALRIELHHHLGVDLARIDRIQLGEKLGRGAQIGFFSGDG